MRGSIVRLLLIAGLAAVPLTAAHAAPFTYSESVSGDLPDGFLESYPEFPFPFAVGPNKISGSTSVTFYGNQNITLADPDSFAFSIPNGLSLVSVMLFFSTTTIGDVLGAGTYFTLCNSVSLTRNSCPVGLDAETFALLGAFPVSAFELDVPLGPGTYEMFNDTMSITYFDSPSLTDPAAFNTDYTWVFSVRPTVSVPEPATLALLGLGLAGLGFSRRKGSCFMQLRPMVRRGS